MILVVSCFARGSGLELECSVSGHEFTSKFTSSIFYARCL